MTPPSPDEPSITVTRNGPYHIRGLPLTRRRQVLSEYDEPLTWQTTEQLSPGEEYWLCRCGRSGSKPFCDGSHGRAETDPAAGATGEGRPFDGTETAPPTAYRDRARDYEGTGIVVADDRSLCEHAGFCGTRVTNVWRMVRHDDVADSATRAQVMAMVERCPSGALTYRLDADGTDIEPPLRPQVGIVDDGPLSVTGGVRIERSDGTVEEVRNRVTLCRCGTSKNKPFRDGSHVAAGFRDSSAAPAAVVDGGDGGG
jgi:CDGSH-type Zn-finger protein